MPFLTDRQKGRSSKNILPQWIRVISTILQECMFFRVLWRRQRTVRKDEQM